MAFFISHGKLDESSIVPGVIALYFKNCANDFSLHIQGDKSVGDSFRGANQCPRDEKVYPTLEATGIFTPFAEK